MQDFMNGILGRFQGNEGQARLYGLGLIASQLGAGQTPNAGPALQMLQDRQAQNQLRSQMQDGGFMDMFSPEEQAYLSTLPPAVAQELIGQRIFAQPEPVQPHFTDGGLVLDPITGAVIADHRQQGGVDQPSSVREYEFAQSQGYTGSYEEWRASRPASTSVTVNSGAESNNWGDPPKDMVWLLDESGNVVTQPDTSGQGVVPIAVPIAGGPADTSTADANRGEGAAIGAANVLETVGDLRASIEANPNMTTGFIGSLIANVPGTDAYDATALTNTVRSNLAFDQLQAMREASPTGGALGAVSAPELQLLESNVANLDLGQSTPQVMRQLETIERDYTRILRKAYATSADPAALDAIFGGRPSFIADGGAVTTDMSDQELLELYSGGN